MPGTPVSVSVDVWLLDVQGATSDNHHVDQFSDHDPNGQVIDAADGFARTLARGGASGWRKPLVVGVFVGLAVVLAVAVILMMASSH